jgi:glutathione S-transferase
VTYELHIGNKNYSSWSLRPWVLMKVLAIPFTERQWLFAAAGNYERFRVFSPTGLVPSLHDGSSVVWETPSIAEYLHERHAGVWHRQPRHRAWARSAVAEMHAGFRALRNECSMNCGVRVQMKGVSPALASDLRRLDELWAQGLHDFGGPYLAGAEFTAVDAFFAPVAFRMQTYSLPFNEMSLAYLGRLLALPAMKQWYEQGVAETWREPSHEAEIHAAGTVTADYRAEAT